MTDTKRPPRVIWQGRQWRVLRDGSVETIDRRYSIGRDRLFEPFWFDHLAEKDWTDLEDFAEALRLARAHAR